MPEQESCVSGSIKLGMPKIKNRLLFPNTLYPLRKQAYFSFPNES